MEVAEEDLAPEVEVLALEEADLEMTVETTRIQELPDLEEVEKDLDQVLSATSL